MRKTTQSRLSRVLIVGANSGMGRALAAELAKQRTQLILAGRDLSELQKIASDLTIRYGVQVEMKHFEALDYKTHGALIEDCTSNTTLDGLIICHGYMVEEDLSEKSFLEAKTTIDINFVSYVSLISHAVDYLQTRDDGFVCAVSSVAGDRGRQSNYTYGASKGALSIYLQGLRNRLAKDNINVITVKPGFVDTAMTWGLLDVNSPTVAQPEKIAVDIVKAIEHQKDVIYTPWFWRWIMLIIRLIPEALFKRLKL